MMMHLQSKTMSPLREQSYADDQPVKLSICCISFNHANYIAQCLDGFLDQRCDFRVEIVIYDDGSTDQTGAVIQNYATRHPTIFRTILMTDNQFSKGVNPYFVYVFPAARGEYIAFCDGDDFWTDPTKLMRQVEVLDSDPEIVLTFGRVRGVDENGADTPYKGGIERDLSAEQLKAAPPINTLTTCFRNIFRHMQMPLYIRTSPIGDLAVWSMLGYHGQARFLPELAPASYRLRPAGLISMQKREQQIMLGAAAYMHIAAYHIVDQNDTGAGKAAIATMTAVFNEMGLGTLVYRPSESLRRKYKRWARKIRHRLRRRLAFMLKQS